MLNYRSMFPGDIFSQVERFQRDLQEAFDLGPTIRGTGYAGFPAMNVGGTQKSVDVFVFAPGLDPASINVELEHGVLTVAGERPNDFPTDAERMTVQINERFHGVFRRVVTLPDDIDPDAVQAQYQDGILHITVGRRAELQPRRISVH